MTKLFTTGCSGIADEYRCIWGKVLVIIGPLKVSDKLQTVCFQNLPMSLAAFDTWTKSIPSKAVEQMISRSKPIGN